MEKFVFSLACTQLAIKVLYKKPFVFPSSTDEKSVHVTRLIQYILIHILFYVSSPRLRPFNPYLDANFVYHRRRRRRRS